MGQASHDEVEMVTPRVSMVPIASFVCPVSPPNVFAKDVTSKVPLRHLPGPRGRGTIR